MLGVGSALVEGTIIEKNQYLTENDFLWEIEADYIAQCAYNTTLIFSPDVIIFSGGVMQQEYLKKKVQKNSLTNEGLCFLS